METLLHLSWEGPFRLSDLDRLNSSERDFGIYQIYATHPIYGYDLVYIGKAREQTFSARIKQENWDVGLENDPQQIAIYVGRLIGPTPQLLVWRNQIDAAEKLLIHSHAPAYNSVNILRSPTMLECGDVRVINWGACRSLSREVSGSVWTAKGVHFRDQHPYNTGAMPHDIGTK